MARETERIAALDVARGGTMLLVIVWHSYLAARTIGPVAPAIEIVNAALQTVRMPLFFFCSGLLAFWGLNRKWGDILKGRVWTMVWIYLVWSTLTFGLDQVYPVSPWREGPQELSSFLWLSYNGQWFVYALVCATLFARAIYFLPVTLQVTLTLGAQALLHLWSPDLSGYTTNFGYLITTMASYGLLFFLLGIWMARMAVPVMKDPRRAALVVAAGLPVWMALLALQQLRIESIPDAAVAAPGVFAGLALASLVSRLRAIRAPLQWLGQRTLELFVCHQFVVGLATLACVSAGLPATPAFAVIAAATIALAVAFARTSAGTGARLLFRPPRGISRQPRTAPI